MTSRIQQRNPVESTTAQPAVRSAILTAALFAACGAIGCAAGGGTSPNPDDETGGSSQSTLGSTGGVVGVGGLGTTLPTGGTPAYGGSPTGPTYTGGTTGAGGSPSAGGSPGASGTTSTGGTTTTATGGSAGSAGAPSGSVTIAPANLIDDLEDGDGSIARLGGRDGAWYTYNDGTMGGTQMPVAGSTFVPEMPGDASTMAAHTSGMGFTTWGAGMGFDLNNDGSSKMPYDASAFTSLVFSAKGTPFRLNVLTSATTPMSDGGTCTGTSAQCGDHFGMAIPATSDWQQFVVPFSSITQVGWGTKTTFDASKMIGVQFQVAQNVTFDIWIDTVGFN